MPGRSNGTLDIIGRIERGAITPIGRADIPRSLTAVLAKGMAPRPADRYQDVVQFVRALQRVELELGYAPTGIDLPTFGAEAFVRNEDDGGDETRMRPVAIVEAQPRVEPRPIAAPPAQTVQQPPAGAAAQPARQVAPAPVPRPAVEADATQLRGIVPLIETQAPPAPAAQTVLRPRTVDAQAGPGPAASATAAAGAEGETSAAENEKSSKRALVISIVAGAAIVLAGAAVLISTLVNPGDDPKTPASTSPAAAGVGTAGSQLPPQITPPAVKASPAYKLSADGKSVTFFWKNSQPKAGDQSIWQSVSDPTNIHTIAATQVTVPVPHPGAQVCIDVEILRASKSSASPLRECNQ